MTEGPEARAIADRMRDALAGRPLERVRYRLRDGTEWPAEAFRGRRVRAVESHGKNLLVHLDGDQSFRIHLLMHGRVRIDPEDAPLEGELRLSFHAGGLRVAVVGAPRIELLPTSEVEKRRGQWGPDATQPGFDPERFVANLVAEGETSVGEALLDQAVVAGIGNMWKCEILHAARIDPRALCAQLTLAERGRLGTLVPEMMRASYESRLARKRIPARVYHRAGRPCRVCGALIVHYRLGNRSTYACPVCQPARRGESARA